MTALCESAVVAVSAYGYRVERIYLLRLAINCNCCAGVTILVFFLIYQHYVFFMYLLLCDVALEFLYQSAAISGHSVHLVCTSTVAEAWSK